ncbi:aminotransferase class V-fold PLP-dependent enzyme, partial [Candidatus Saccharibacteria bacterium]|nr:aminotransferase class V-fold PLP-dependent enzyme [Candidatus Saccharibacteria bacterium]
MKKIYLDYAAATPMALVVAKAMEPYLTKQFYNPSAQYLAAKQVAQAVATARQQIAQWLGARPSEIIFTAGGTEANNLAIQGIMQQFPRANLVVSAIEHEAVLMPARRYKHHLAPVRADGVVNLAALDKIIDQHTVLVSIIYANNEIGTVEPLKQIAELLQRIRDQRRQVGHTLPLYFHTDACQAAVYLDLHTSRLGVDLMTLNAGKLYGPKQCGALYVKTGVELLPQIVGGGQERGLRSGTENVANIIGLATALNLVQTQRRAEAGRLSHLQR